jgi:hypothetical protein
MKGHPTMSLRFSKAGVRHSAAVPPAQPTFTPTSSEPDAGTVPRPALAPDDTVPDTTMEDDAVAQDYAVAEPARGYPATPDVAGTRPQPVSGTTGLDEPLLSDATALRERWQQVQAGFVDDPQEAVGDAADLIEQTTQALVGALRQRQRQLRMQWERGSANGTAPQGSESAEPGAAGAGGAPDTEHLRLLMQRYRSLFNQLCRP